MDNVETQEKESNPLEGLSESEISFGRENGLLPKEEKAAEPIQPENKESAPEPKQETVFDKPNPDGPQWADLESKDQAKRDAAHTHFTPREKASFYEFRKAERRAKEQRAELAALREEMRALRESLKAPREEEASEEEAPKDINALLDERERKKAEEAEAKERSKREKAEKMEEAWAEAEEAIKAEVQDYDATVALANDLIENATKYWQPESREFKRAQKIANAMRNATINAASLTESDWTGPELAYELGKLHPKYGQKNAAPVATKRETGNPGLTPEQAKRIAANANKPGTSAAVSGGSAERMNSEDDITADIVKRWTTREFNDRFYKLSKEKQAQLLAEL